MTWFLLLAALSLVGVADAASQCDPDGLQASGSIYRICLPDQSAYNKRLVIWAHGFQDAGEPVSIPEDQLRTENFSIQEFVNNLGFGFATNSYSKTGLAVRQGMADILDLVNLYTAAHGAPERIYLIGASEGGLITALLIEQNPDIFTGGLAACGPVGDFRYQIGYIGNARATFDYFFPSVIPDQGDPFHPSPDLIAAWGTVYQPQVAATLAAPENRRSLNQWSRVADLVFDPARPPETKTETGVKLLHYAVVNLNDAAATLGGFPFGNAVRRYSGSSDDAALNAQVPRITADPAALQEMRAHYDTSGQLGIPLITLHSSQDSLIPYEHEKLYIDKTKATGDYRKYHFNIKTSNYGHCQFTEGEVLLAVGMLGLATGETSFVDSLASKNVEEPVRREFKRLSRLNNLKIRFSDGKIRIRLPGGLRL